MIREDMKGRMDGMIDRIWMLVRYLNNEERRLLTQKLEKLICELKALERSEVKNETNS